MKKPVILLVDDDKTMLNSLMDQLRNAFKGEYLLEAVQTIAEAKFLLAMLQEQGIQVKLIISDWLMPPDRTNGFLEEVYQARPDINLIMLSGYADEASVNSAFENAKLKAFVRKPWDEDELISLVRKTLAHDSVPSLA